MTTSAKSGSEPGNSPASTNLETPKVPRIVTFGGGTGMAAVLRGLKGYTDHITAVVTVTDNGGSSGRLRTDFDIAAPGDIRNCLIALADVDPLIAKVFQYRFHEAGLKGHSFGNLFITVLARVVGGFQTSISELNRLLRVRGKVVPAADQKVSLVAHHADGTKSTGEVQITKSGKRIQRVELRPYPIAPSTEILQAINDADLFLFGPGSLYTSVIPNLLLDGIVGAINATAKPRVYISNIMTQPGETTGYKLSDHLEALRDHVGDGFVDAVLVHRGEIPARVLAKYETSGAEPVECDLTGQHQYREVRIVEENFFAEGEPEDEAVEKTGTVRHDSTALARVIHQEFLVPLVGSRSVGDKRNGGGADGGESTSADRKAAVRTHGTRTLP